MSAGFEPAASSAAPLPWGEVGSHSDPGERLSEESSCIGVLGTRIACFCVEADEQFMGESNPDGHFVFSCGEQSFSESRKGLVVLSGGPRDHGKERSDAGAAAAGRSFAPPLSPVVGDRGEGGEAWHGVVWGSGRLPHARPSAT